LSLVSAHGPLVDLERELGRGATGTVALGRLRAPFASWPTGTEVAVKTLLPELRDDAAARAALAAEAAAGRRVSDPSLARVLHHDEEGDEGPRLVFEYVPGRSLRETLDEDGPVPEPLLRRVGAQVAGALAALHAAGLAHGDVKPENVRLGPDGRAVLVDLGFAAAPGTGAAGTVRYLSPERARGGGAGPAADVFALGVVLYELACGRHPFLDGEPGGRSSRRAAAGPRAEDALARIEAAKYAPPSHRAPELSALLDDLLEGLLARAPARRPPAREVRTRLEEGEAGAWWRTRAAGEDHLARLSVAGRHLLPVVGRDRELGALEALRRRAHGTGDALPRGAAAWVSGEAGAGKSRLLEELAVRARRQEPAPLYLYGRCRPYGETRPAEPLLAIARRWLALPPGAAPGPRERARLAQLLPPEDAEVLALALDPDAREAPSLARPLAGLVVALSGQRPVIAFVDDVHRADGETLSALRRLADGLAGRPVLLALGVRRDEAPALPRDLQRLRERLERRSDEEGGPELFRLELRPLARADVDELARLVFHHSAPRLRLGAELWRRSMGSPGLVAEVLREAVARGLARAQSAEDPRLVLLEPPERLPMPGSLGTVTARRLRELDAGDRKWVERLAVVGGRIEPDFLLRAFPPTGRAEVDGVLARLVRGGWLVPAGALYRFSRPALREAVYRATPNDRRRRLHASAARALAPGPGAEIGVEDAFQRAFHLRAAGNHGALLRVLRPLLAALRERGQAQRVFTLARWGLDALDARPAAADRGRRSVEFLEAAADAADRLGRREEQRVLLDRLADPSLDPEENPGLAARVYLLHGRYAAATGALGMAGGLLRNAVELAGRTRDGRLSSEALRRLANVRAQVGELAEARDLARRAGRATDDPRHVALAWLARAQIDVHEGRLDEGLRTVSRALSVLRRRVTPLPVGIVAFAQVLRARILRSVGLPDRGLAAASRAHALAARAGERRLEAEAGARVGALLLDLDRAEEAEARLRDALLLAREIEDARGQTLASVWLGLLLWERYDGEALSHLDRAIELASECGFLRAQALALALRARVRRHDGSLELALVDSAAALQTLERVDAELFDRVAIAGTRVLVLRSAERSSEADELLATLQRRLARDTRRLAEARLRTAQRRYTTRLLAAVLSPEGVIFPRISEEAAERL
jgi:tetratricopeptide (TPR) repeat protein